jgi:hypothetical protein
MNLPKSWNEIDVIQFKEIRELYAIEEVFTREIEILAALADIPSDDLEDLDITEVSDMLKDITFINSEPSKNYKHVIGEYHYKPLNTLTVGEFIDLEHYFAKDYNQHVGHIASILFRKVMVNEWGENVWEPYTYKPSIRYSVFDEVCINDVYGILPEYLAYRDSFMTTYANLFTDEDGSDEDEDERPATSDEAKEIALRKSEKKWGWERLIYSLCNEDLTKFHEVTNLSLIMTFNMLGMKKELNV